MEQTPQACPTSRPPVQAEHVGSAPFGVWSEARTGLLGRQSVQHPGIWNGLSDVLEAADPGHQAFNAHPKPGMRYVAVPTQVEIPLECLLWQAVFGDPPEEKVEVVEPQTPKGKIGQEADEKRRHG